MNEQSFVVAAGKGWNYSYASPHDGTMVETESLIGWLVTLGQDGRPRAVPITATQARGVVWCDSSKLEPPEHVLLALGVEAEEVEEVTNSRWAE